MAIWQEDNPSRRRLKAKVLDTYNVEKPHESKAALPLKSRPTINIIKNPPIFQLVGSLGETL